MSGLAEAAAAAAGAAQDQGGAAQNQQSQQSQPGAQGQQDQQSADGGDKGGDKSAAAEIYKPAGIADHLVGANDRETIDKLLGAYNPLREKVSKYEPAKNAADLKFEPGEALKPYFGAADAPAMKIAQEAWVKGGGTAASFGPVLESFYTGMIEAKLLPPPYDPKGELATFAKAAGLSGDKAVNDALTEAISFTDNFATQLKLSDAAKDELGGLTDTAAGLELVGALRKLLDGKGIELGGGGGGGGNWTREQLRALQSDPRLDPKSDKFDRDFHKQVEDAYKRLDQK